MAKFGKLELTDDSDEDTEKARGVSRKKRAIGTIIISSDEEDEVSSDLTSLSPSPTPARRKFLKESRHSSKGDNATERPEATVNFFGSIGKSVPGGTSNIDDKDVIVMKRLAENNTSPPNVQKTVAVDLKEEDSDCDNVCEIAPPVQVRNIRAEMGSMKTKPYNKSSKNSLTQSRTISAASTNPGNHIVPAPSSSQTHAPHPNVPSSTIKLKITVPPKMAPRRSQKQSSGIMSWNQSKRVQPAPIRPLLLAKPTGDVLKSPKSSKTRLILKPIRIPVSPANSFPFTSKDPFLPRPRRPLVPPQLSLNNDDLVPVASSSNSADLAPSLDPAKPAEVETGIDVATPISATKSQEVFDIPNDIVSDTSFVSSEGNEDITSTASPNEGSQLSVESSTPEQNTYVLTTEYDRQLYKAVRSQWAPLARMREQVANARFTAGTDEDVDISSGSEGDAGLTTKGGRWYGGLGYGSKSGDTGVPAMETTGENDSLQTQPGRTHTTEENLSVALAMRRYTKRLWSVASNARSIWAGASLAEENIQSDEVEEKEGNTTRVLQPEAPTLQPENRRERSDGLPTPSSDIKPPPHTQSVARSLSGDPSSTPVPLNTPLTGPSTATTLVNAFTTSKDHASSPEISKTSLEPISWVLRSPTPVQSPIGSALTNDLGSSCQAPPSYDFSYESTAMHIGSASWDENSFAMVRSIARHSVGQTDSKIENPDLLTQREPPGPIVTSYRPTRHFLGVEPPSIPGTKRYILHAARGLVESHEAVEAEGSFSEVEDLSGSELTPHAFRAYKAALFEHSLKKGDQKQAKKVRKRKGVHSESSAPEEEPEYDDHTVPKKKKVQRGSRKRRKLSQAISLIDSDAPLSTLVSRSIPTGRPLRLRATGATVDVPLGLGVDDIDPSSIEVRQIREGTVGTTTLCHQCRCGNTHEKRKVQCGNVTIHVSSPTSSAPGSITRSARCNKAFCERCLRGWYGFDDDAIAFVRRGQQILEGKGAGTGIGLGIVEGKWICPCCIDLCMCTVCSKKRNVERAKYAPSVNAVIAGVASRAVVSRPRPTSAIGTRTVAQSTVGTAESDPQPISPTHLPVIRLPRRIGPPPVPTQWLPAIPTPTPGLDPIYYEATRPCTRDFPTGAPQPTAANHAPILYHVGADLENDGLEDSFTGSEMSEDEQEESRVSEYSARIGGSGDNQLDPEVASSSVVAQATRKNFLIVTPGRRMPSTMKKTQEHPKGSISSSLPTLSHPLMTPDTPEEPHTALDGIALVSLESPAKSYIHAESPILDRYPATVDPMQLVGSRSGSHAEESSTQNLPSAIDMAQAGLNFSSRHADSSCFEDAALDLGEVTVHTNSEDDNNSSADVHFMPHFDDYEMHLNEEVQIGSPTLAMGDYHDFLPIMSGDENVTEGLNFPLDSDGDVLMDDGFFSLLLRHPSSYRDPDLLTSIDEGEAADLLGYH